MSIVISGGIDKEVTKKRKYEKNHKKGKAKKFKPQPQEDEKKAEENETKENVSKKPKVEIKLLSPEEIAERYPILNDTELIKKFLAVPLKNNQKGRLRQLLRDSLKGTSDNLLPDVINGRIQAILKSSKELTEPELRKIRLLHNMLKTAVQSGIQMKKDKVKKETVKKEEKETVKKEEKVKNDEAKDVKVEKEEGIENVAGEKVVSSDNKEKIKKEQKVKGPKRYVVFVGNLPLNIEKERILEHFSELSDRIVDVRLPPREGKSSIAYVELKDEHSYELALSKHHSMLDKKRINVLYTTQKNSKISKSEAKSTSAKLVALQKSGKLIGSIPLNRKRSYRRNKAKRARAKAEQNN